MQNLSITHHRPSPLTRENAINIGLWAILYQIYEKENDKPIECASTRPSYSESRWKIAEE